MFAKRFLSFLSALVMIFCAVGTAAAADVACDTVYCFSREDFSPEEEPVTGICITELPDSQTGTVMLGTRVLRPGDILTAQQLPQMTFVPLRTEEDATACVSYLPIYENRVAPSATMTISILGKEDKAPIAEDFAAETYKNLPIDGKLKVKDPEEQALTYTVTRNPKRGEVTIQPDGSFTYTPKKNKVGIDSFIYTATDPAGNVSREATVTITIVKPTDATQYTDTLGQSCRFAAEWMKNTGIFVGESLDGNACFNPQKEVTKGEFLTMLVKTLEIPTDETAIASVYDSEYPTWLQPYLAAAVRSGLVAGLPDVSTFQFDTPISGGEAAVMLQNALDLSISDAQAMAQEEGLHWADSARIVLAENGITLNCEETLTRSQAAEVLYQACQLSRNAPGMTVFRAGNAH